jgi:type IV-A pilus assembly ATPase PilB
VAVPEKIRKGLGEQLVEKGLLQRVQLEHAEREARRSREPLRRVLIRLGYVTEEVIMIHLADELNIPFISLNNYLIGEDVIRLVPEDLARKYTLIPIFRVDDSLTVAMADPLNIYATDELKLRTKLDVETCLAIESEIRSGINQYYSVSEDMSKVIQSLEGEAIDISMDGDEKDVKKLESLVEEAPVIKLVNMVFLEAIRQGSSDVHIEPEENLMRIRYRVDGVMHEASTVPRKLQAAITSRIKILSNLDIAERRIAQDGRFHIRVGQRQIDMRVSVVPTIYGENVVVRLLDTTKMMLKLPDLGLNPVHLKAYDAIIRKSYGIVLITGPTGSGKTTTLYASLNQINDVGKNIITIEDPVEYRLAMIRQIQVNPKVELTFASGLRSILRQDPDIIMVGEIRDEETARIAIQAALTGHLVFSTVHTNDSIGAVTRLVDMGIEPFLVSSAAVGFVAQRLVRVLCKECKAPYHPTKEELKILALGEGEPRALEIYAPVGCPACRKSGFKGRLAIYEVFTLDEETRAMIVKRVPSEQIKQHAVEHGMKTLKDDGLDKVKQGITSLEEILRVVQD